VAAAIFAQPAQAQTAHIVFKAQSLFKKTGITVHAGDVVTISASARWRWNDDMDYVGPGGDTSDDFNAFDLFEPFDFFSQARLIAFIGDFPKQKHFGDASFFPQTSGYLSIGSGQTFVAPYGGKLWVGFNDGAVTRSVADNGGRALVDVAIKPAGTVGPEISVVSPGGVYRRGDVVQVHYSCSGNAVASCTGPVADGGALNADAAGHYAFTVVAKDADGNTASKTIPYVVTDESSAALLPTGAAFDPTALGSRSAIKAVTLTNPQPATLTIDAITVADDFNGDFHISGSTCGATLGPRHSCKVSVYYQPTTASTARAALRVSASMPVTDAPLWGNGTQVRALPAALAFGDETAGLTSAPQTVKLTNGQAGALNIREIAATGDFATDASSTCPLTGGKLGAGKTCTIAVTFTPGAAGPRSGALVVHVPGVAVDPSTIPLAGNGIPN